MPAVFLIVLLAFHTAAQADVEIKVLGKSFAELEGFTATTETGRPVVVTGDVSGSESENPMPALGLFDPEWEDTRQLTDSDAASLVLRSDAGPGPTNPIDQCEAGKSDSCCPLETDTLYLKTRLGWLNTFQGCGPAADHGVSLSVYDLTRVNRDLADLLRGRFSLTYRFVLATLGPEERPVYLKVEGKSVTAQDSSEPTIAQAQEAAPAHAAGARAHLLCVGSVQNACWTSPDGQFKCEQRPGSPDRKWRKLYCGAGQPWESVGTCSCQ